MSKSYTMDELISGYFEKQFAEVDKVPLPKFSFRHRLTMKRIFKLFEHNKAMSDINAEDTCENVLGHKQLSFRKRLIIAVAIIVCLAVMTGFVIAFISGGFNGTVYQDNTHLFAIDTANCPSTIEKEYSLSVVPEGFEMYDVSATSTDITVMYCNPDTEQVLVFGQTVKSEFNPHINTEGFDLQETNVNSCNAVYIEYNSEQGVSSIVIWDNKDYVLMLSGDFDKNELLNLSISNEINGF